jgi:hypothetical protein
VREFQWRGGVSETASTDDSPTIAEQIRASADPLTERERKAAQTLLTDDPTAGLGPVAEFAQRARVSADRPALCRQARMSWLPGFPEAIAGRTGGPAPVVACQAGAYGQAAQPSAPTIDPFAKAGEIIRPYARRSTPSAIASAQISNAPFRKRR